jgi:hypothetical protein
VHQQRFGGECDGQARTSNPQPPIDPLDRVYDLFGSNAAPERLEKSREPHQHSPYELKVTYMQRNAGEGENNCGLQQHYPAGATRA